METGLDRGMISFLLAVLLLLWLLYLRFRFLEYLRVQVSSRVPLFFLISVGSLWCASVFILLGWSEFAFEALACVSDVNIELYSGNDADSLQFPVVAGAPTSTSI